LSRTYKTKPNNEREYRLLMYIIRYKTQNGGHSPSYREMQTALANQGIGPLSTSVIRYYLLHLHNRGHIILKDNGANAHHGGKNIQIGLPGEKYTVSLPYDPTTLDPRQLKLPTVGE